MAYQITAEKPSDTPGHKAILRVEYPSFTEAWLSMRKWTEAGWRVTETPTQPEWPTFPVDLGNAA